MNASTAFHHANVCFHTTPIRKAGKSWEPSNIVTLFLSLPEKKCVSLLPSVSVLKGL